MWCMITGPQCGEKKHAVMTFGCGISFLSPCSSASFRVGGRLGDCGLGAPDKQQSVHFVCIFIVGDYILFFSIDCESSELFNRDFCIKWPVYYVFVLTQPVRHCCCNALRTNGTNCKN